MSRTASFARGDRVRLKTGGPDMTVSDPASPVGADHVETTWFDSQQKRHHDVFHIDLLESCDHTSVAGNVRVRS
jgi:uncharacterized protein YodC (DUF2158 family)